MKFNSEWERLYIDYNKTFQNSKNILVKEVTITVF